MSCSAGGRRDGARSRGDRFGIGWSRLRYRRLSRGGGGPDNRRTRQRLRGFADAWRPRHDVMQGWRRLPGDVLKISSPEPPILSADTSGTTAYQGNRFDNNNGGNANPEVSGGVEIGGNVCAGNTTCP